MPKAEYLEQRNKIQADLKNAAGKLQEIEANLSELPTLEEYESPAILNMNKTGYI